MRFLKKPYILLFFLIVPFTTIIADPPPPGLPIDGGLTWLIVAGAALGVYQLRKKKN
jgi:hypothetical protein